MSRSKTDLPKLKPGSASEPSVFGKYFLHGMISRGGMAEVYRARLAKSDQDPRLLAIKVMRPSIAREARFVDMFNREGQLAMLLQNPSIVRTLEVGKADGRHYIAMEYLSGQDLTHVLRRCQEKNQRIPIPHAVFIASRIVEGLAFAHNLAAPDGRQLNIVNRDVSPSNVRITYRGEAKLLDFGIAQALMKYTSEIGILKGKFSYMSPEQIRGMPVDARSDIFSAGIVLHEMLTTEKLFRGDTEFALMEKVRKAEIPAPSDYNRRIPGELDRITLRALARDVSSRYQTATEFHQDLSRVLDNYRFNHKELRQFVRQLFRREFVQEQDECDIALYSVPRDHEDEDVDTEREAPHEAAYRIAELDTESELRDVLSSADDGDAPENPHAPQSVGNGENPGGFWGRFRRKRK